MLIGAIPGQIVIRAGQIGAMNKFNSAKRGKCDELCRKFGEMERECGRWRSQFGLMEGSGVLGYH